MWRITYAFRVAGASGIASSVPHINDLHSRVQPLKSVKTSNALPFGRVRFHMH